VIDNTYAFTTFSKKSSMYWKYPGSATVSLWLPLGNSRHVLGALQIWYKRAICDALSQEVSDQVKSTKRLVLKDGNPWAVRTSRGVSIFKN
jgi:hypothetical protein